MLPKTEEAPVWGALTIWGFTEGHPAFASPNVRGMGRDELTFRGAKAGWPWLNHRETQRSVMKIPGLQVQGQVVCRPFPSSVTPLSIAGECIHHYSHVMGSVSMTQD